MKVLNFGSLNMDQVYRVDHFVQPGETLSARSQERIPGGKGLNQSAALARAGAQVWHAGAVGEGGSSLKTLLEKEGVRTEYLREVPELQGNAMIQVNDNGENCILLFGGSNRCITKEQVDETIGSFEKGDFLVLQNEINLLSYIVDRAYEKGMVIVLNPSPYDEKLEDTDFGKLDWILVNEVEAEQISRSSDPEKAWEIIHGRYPGLSCVITLGKAGSIGFRVREGKTETVRQKAYPVRAVDTTAAGDTYTGYFISRLIRGESLADCMRLAAAASAISVTRYGAAPSVPTEAEVAAWLAGQKEEE